MFKKYTQLLDRINNPPAEAPYADGKQAQQRGYPSCNNPYDPRSLEWNEWDRGWWDAWKEDHHGR